MAQRRRWAVWTRRGCLESGSVGRRGRQADQAPSGRVAGAAGFPVRRGGRPNRDGRQARLRRRAA